MPRRWQTWAAARISAAVPASPGVSEQQRRLDSRLPQIRSDAGADRAPADACVSPDASVSRGSGQTPGVTLKETPADTALPDDREATLTFVPALDGLREIALPPLVVPTRTSRA
jgi:hypothetical protein